MFCYRLIAMEQANNICPSLKELYPKLSGEELRMASENIDRYLHLILRISKRIETADRLGDVKDG